MVTLRNVGLVAVLLAVGAASALGQELPTIRRSAEATPRVSDAAIVRQQRVDVTAFADLADPVRSRVLELDLFPDVSFRAVRQSSGVTGNAVTWSGTLEGLAGSSAVFAVVGNEVVGHIQTSFGFFRLESQPGGGYIVKQVDQTTFPEGPDEVIPPPEEPPVPARAAADSRWRTLADDGSVVDVMVAYTQEALAGFGSGAAAGAAIALVVAETNQALTNSLVNARVRLVHTTLVNYTESGAGSTDLGRLQSSTDGFLDEVHTLRNRYAADLVVLITERANDVCGIAYLNGAQSSGQFGFGLVQRRCAANGRTFAHELGHNMGATHDWYVSSLGSGAFTYSKGHVSLAGRFLDVMSYTDRCRAAGITCTQLLTYSNPTVLSDGLPTGVAAGTNLTCTLTNVDNPNCDADVARTFRTLMPVVARFRDSAASAAIRQILPGASVRSDNLRYRLTYQLDGNLVLTDEQLSRVVWATNTGGPAGQVAMQGDGNLVIYTQAGVPVWASGTAGNTDAVLIIQNDGNVVIYDRAGVPIWDRNR
jgi:hypothetical protein